jgi:hypothetical protein
MKFSRTLLATIALLLLVQTVTSFQFKTLSDGGNSSSGSNSTSGGDSSGSGSGSDGNSTSGDSGSGKCGELRDGDLKGYNGTWDNTTRDKADDGKSGLVKINLPGTSEYLTIKFRGLQDSEGQRAKNFENASWTWAGPTAGTCSGLKCATLTASGSVSVSGKSVGVVVTALLFNETGNYAYGNSSVAVDPNSVKFSYNITNWPFSVANGSFLYLALTVSSGGNGVNLTSSGQGFTIGNGVLSTPTFAYVDEKYAPISVKFKTDADDSQGCQAKILFAFPQFAHNVYYDPVASASSTSTAAPSSKAALSARLSILAALLAVIMLFFMHEL